jgi:outer membrane biosynthesis protein TonB
MTEPERGRDRWVSAVLSVLLHAALIGVIVYGWWRFHHRPKPEPTLAINATVVGPQALPGGGAPKRTPPVAAVQTAPPPPALTEEEQTVPMPKPEASPPPQVVPKPEDAQRKAAEQQAAQKAREAQAEADRKAKAAEEAKKAKERAERLAEAKRKAQEERRAEEAKELAVNQSDLEQSVADEEKSLAARSGPAMASWKQLIEARIHQAWIQPPTVRNGLDCTLTVTQVPGGQITDVKLGSCNGDAAVQQSIEDAAYRASPLPPPPDPALFVRELTIHFTHSDNSSP